VRRCPSWWRARRILCPEPFQTTVLGCGDTIPADYDPTKQTRFKVNSGITEDEAVEEFRLLCREKGPDRALDVCNGGNDLDDRAHAFDGYLPTRSLSDDKKVAWMMSNQFTVCVELEGDRNKVLSWYNANIQE
jgi:hypothetical protein